MLPLLVPHFLTFPPSSTPPPGKGITWAAKSTVIDKNGGGLRSFSGKINPQVVRVSIDGQLAGFTEGKTALAIEKQILRTYGFSCGHLERDGIFLDDDEIVTGENIVFVDGTATSTFSLPCEL